MRLRVSYFCLPKGGNSDDEYEDAFYPVYPSDEDLVRDRCRLGVADGATEGYLSRQWADCLVRSFASASSLRLDETLVLAADCWERSLNNYLARRARTGRPLQWFEEAKLERGAFATFLGVQFRTRRWSAHKGSWSAAAVGDTCLFHVRDEAVRSTFPVSEAGGFDNAPDLVASTPSLHSEVHRLARRAAGEWMHGDSFFLATDALAAWFLGALERNEAPWRVLRDLDTDAQPPFPVWVEELRRSGLMRNDDVTLVRIEID
jgi:hypothetical protein